MSEEYGLQGHVYAAVKSVHSPALLRAASSVARFDVASNVELELAMACGARGDSIVATGPKNRAFLNALLHQPAVTISVDSLGELRYLAEKNANNPLLLRLTRTVLNRPTVTKKSRFGLDAAALVKAVALARKHALQIRGVGFHIDTQSVQERAHAIIAALSVLDRLQDEGFAAYVMDIGGSFGASYGMTRVAIDEFERTLREAPGRTTWQQHRYGLDEHGKGALSGLDMPSGDTEATRLRAILATRIDTGTVADMLRDTLVELWCEPGSGLFNEMGVVVSNVIDVALRDEQWQVVVDMHRNQICFEGNETPLDPILVGGGGAPRGLYALLGNLCAENDVLTYRLVKLPAHPQVGDALVWTHTAAYRSHFSASSAIGHPLAARFYFDQGEFYDDIP